MENIEKDILRSKVYKNKTIKAQNFITIMGTRYFKRIFTDESVELVRFDLTSKKWVILCFLR